MTDAPSISSGKSSKKEPSWRRVGVAAFGVIALALGVIALFTPFIATLAATNTLAILLLASGAAGVVTMIADWRARGSFWRLLWAIVAIIAGGCILLHPWPGALTLTVILGASFIVQGALAVGHAASHRHSKGCPWGWMALSGVLSVVLGALLIWALPEAGLVIPGVFLAVNLVSFGMSMMAAAFAKDELSTL
jgi:uncharacterized membrane protein HdeD (DUF308 family)